MTTRRASTAEKLNERWALNIKSYSMETYYFLSSCRLRGLVKRHARQCRNFDTSIFGTLFWFSSSKYVESYTRMTLHFESYSVKCIGSRMQAILRRYHCVWGKVVIWIEEDSDHLGRVGCLKETCCPMENLYKHYFHYVYVRLHRVRCPMDYCLLKIIYRNRTPIPSQQPHFSIPHLKQPPQITTPYPTSSLR